MISVELANLASCVCSSGLTSANRWDSRKIKDVCSRCWKYVRSLRRRCVGICIASMYTLRASSRSRNSSAALFEVATAVTTLVMPYVKMPAPTNITNIANSRSAVLVGLMSP